MKTTIINQIKGRTANMVMAVLIAGCTAQDKQPVVEKQAVIQPPFADLVQAFDEYAVDAVNGDTIITTSGTKIIIPPHGFVDDSGIVITGKAKIKYREYHDALDVFLSGIPMDYMSQGQRKTMQTAGMFEIRAEKDGRELKLAENKKMDIIFASFESGDDYSFFSFNEDKEEWEFVDYSMPVANPAIKIIAKKIKALKPQFKKTLDNNIFVMNYDAILDIKFNNRWEKIRENRNNPAYRNKAGKYGVRIYNLWNYNSVEFNGIYYPAAMMVWKKLSGNNIPKWDKSKKCDLTEISEHVYMLSVTDQSKNKTYKLKAKCYMPLKYLFKYTPDQWKNNYAELIQKISEEDHKMYEEAQRKMEELEKKLKAQNAVFRAVEISGFGIYNIDRFWNPNTIQIAAAFTLDKPEYNKKYDIDLVFYFPGDNKTLVKIYYYQWKNMNLDTTDQNGRFLTVLSGNKIALFSAEKYSNIDFRSLNETRDSSYTFVMETQKKTITSKADLESILNI